MTHGTTWISRISASFAETRGAWKATPRPADLYPPPQQGMGYGPIGFPGWNEMEKRQTDQTKDERNAKTAIRSPWVYSDIQAIANELSAADLIVKKRSGDKLEDVDNHPLEVLWEAPNEHMGRSYLTAFWAWSYVLASKAYLFWAPGATSGQPREVWPVPPFMISPIPDAKDFIGGYLFKSSPAATAIKIPRELITFSRSVNLFDARDGMSFMVAAMIGIETDLAAGEWNRNFFKESNGVPDGLITVPKDTLDADMAVIRSEIRDFFGGTRRGVAVARAGDMDYKPFGRTQKDAEFLAGRQFSEKEIGRTLGIPDGYWSERANRANAEQARATMIAGAVWPLAVRLAEDLNAQQVRRWYGDEYRVEFKDIRPEDRDLKLKEIETKKAYLTINELRQMDGAEPFPEDDKRGALLVKELEMGAAMPTPEDAPVDAQDGSGDAEALPSDLPPAELPEDGAAEDTPPEDEAKAADLRRWQAKARKALKDGKSAAVAFKSAYVGDDEAEAITEALKAAQTAEDVRAAFDTRAARLIDAVADEADRWARAVLGGGEE